VHDCGPSSHGELYRSLKLHLYCFLHIAHNDWHFDILKFRTLSTYDRRQYLLRKRLIDKNEAESIVFNEKDLIANRLALKNIIVNDDMGICPKHRSSNGVDWSMKHTTCNHPDHKPNDKVSSRDCRQAKFSTCAKIEGFPIGGKSVFLLSDHKDK
jgi:hypothetical protein